MEDGVVELRLFEPAQYLWHKMLAFILTLFPGLKGFEQSSAESMKGKRVLVTGASTGIGEQLAYRYASLGASVAVTARRELVLLEVVKKCEELSPEKTTHYAIAGDMLDLTSTERTVQEAKRLLGGLDILVLNHITTSDFQPFTGSTDQLTMLRDTLDINFRSHIHLLAHALPELNNNDGSIVVVNSLLGEVGHPFQSVYAATKHALTGFFTCLRSQLRMQRSKVTVSNCILGYIGTENSVQRNVKANPKLEPASPVETAAAIVSAGGRRDTVLYYPYWSVRLMVLLQGIAPGLVARITESYSEGYS